MDDASLNAEKTLRSVLSTLADSIESNKKLFSVLLNYLMQLKKSGVDTNERVRRRVIRLRHLLSTILIKGIQSKEFKEINVKDINDTLYGLLESAIFRIAVLNKDDVADVRAALNTTVDLFKA